MERIAWVDDDPDMLAYARHALKSRAAIETYEDAQAALAALRDHGSDIAVIVADMRMPGMDGAQLLAEASVIAPHAIRLMCTGADDQATARRAVNQGHVFRFLAKGAGIVQMNSAVDDALAEFHSRTAERRVLEDTMIGAIRSLMDVVALIQPAAFARSTRIRQLASRLSVVLGCGSWQIELGASLSQLGCIALPPLVMERIAAGREVAPHYERMFEEHPAVGADLLSRIPRLEEVVEIVRCQHKRFDGSGFPGHLPGGHAIPIGARLLKVAIDYDRLRVGGTDSRGALLRMSMRHGWYDEQVVTALDVVIESHDLRERAIPCDELAPGMILMQGLRSRDGAVLAVPGETLTPALAARLAANPPVGGTLVAVLAA